MHSQEIELTASNISALMKEAVALGKNAVQALTEQAKRQGVPVSESK